MFLHYFGMYRNFVQVSLSVLCETTSIKMCGPISDTILGGTHGGILSESPLEKFEHTKKNMYLSTTKTQVPEKSYSMQLQ